MKYIIVFWVSIFIVALVIFAFTGCAGRTVYVDRVVTVKVPVKCEVKEVAKAEKRENSASTLADILRERDELREALKSCL